MYLNFVVGVGVEGIGVSVIDIKFVVSVYYKVVFVSKILVVVEMVIGGVVCKVYCVVVIVG